MPRGSASVLPLLERTAPPATAGSASARLRGDALRLMRGEGLLAGAAWCYEIIALDRVDEGRLHVGGERLHAPRLLPAAGEMTAIAAAVCTLGSALEHRVRSLFRERRTSLALVLDSLGNEALFEVSRRLQDRIVARARRERLDVAGELHPGDPGLDTAAQPAVLRLAGAEQIGCRVFGGGLLEPVKSISMILGVGVDLPAADWSRCDTCPSRERCPMARPSARAAAAGPEPVLTK